MMSDGVEICKGSSDQCDIRSHTHPECQGDTHADGRRVFHTESTPNRYTGGLAEKRRMFRGFGLVETGFACMSLSEEDNHGLADCNGKPRVRMYSASADSPSSSQEYPADHRSEEHGDCSSTAPAVFGGGTL